MNIAIAIFIGLTGLGIGFVVSRLRQRNHADQAQAKAEQILQEAKAEVKQRKKATAEKQHELKRQLLDNETEVKERLGTLEKRLQILQKQDHKWEKRLTKIKNQMQAVKDKLDQDSQARETAKEQMLEQLVKKAGQDKDQVLEELKSNYLRDFQLDYDKFLQKSEYFMKEESPQIAKSILASIMNRYSEPSSVDRLDNTLKVSVDKAKGRIIGKGGQNINYFEEQAQVAVIFNDQDPKTITVSCFHLLRREIARRALIKLAKLRTIEKKNIDRALTAAKKDLDEQLEKIGKWAADVINLPEEKREPELLRLMGRLKFRTSYGQNILYHSLEIAFFSAMMAAEIGADVEVAKLGGFFHDLGKAIDQDDDVDKPHDYLSKEILERFDFSWEIVHAAWTHHDAIPIETIEAELVKAADAISAGRPGARSESAEEYYNRIATLEEMASKTKGVDKAFAMSAGRELRLFMDTDQIKDRDMPEIAAELKTRIENNLSYPGKIKVNLIRRLEAVDYAKDRRSK